MGITFGLPPPEYANHHKTEGVFSDFRILKSVSWGPELPPPAPPLVVKPLTSPTPFGRVNRPACSSLIAENFDYKSLPWTISSGSPIRDKSGPLSKAGVNEVLFWVQFFYGGKGFFFVVFWACVFFCLSPKNIEKYYRKEKYRWLDIL